MNEEIISVSGHQMEEKMVWVGKNHKIWLSC